MNYKLFKEISEGYIKKDEHETDQEYMERIFRCVCERSDDAGEMFNEMLRPSFFSCSFDDKTLVLRFDTEKWMSNPNGNIHGGIIASAIDVTCGLLVRFLSNNYLAATTQLSINYLRPVISGEKLFVKAQADKVGSRIKFLHASVISTMSSDKVDFSDYEIIKATSTSQFV